MVNVICKYCATAADYDEQWQHESCPGCDCHHKPIEGEPRIKLPELEPREYIGAKAECRLCGKLVAVRKDGKLRKHAHVFYAGGPS